MTTPMDEMPVANLEGVAPACAIGDFASAAQIMSNWAYSLGGTSELLEHEDCPAFFVKVPLEHSDAYHTALHDEELMHEAWDRDWPDPENPDKVLFGYFWVWFKQTQNPKNKDGICTIEQRMALRGALDAAGVPIEGAKGLVVDERTTY